MNKRTKALYITGAVLLPIAPYIYLGKFRRYLKILCLAIPVHIGSGVLVAAGEETDNFWIGAVLLMAGFAIWILFARWIAKDVLRIVAGKEADQMEVSK